MCSSLAFFFKLIFILYCSNSDIQCVVSGRWTECVFSFTYIYVFIYSYIYIHICILLHGVHYSMFTEILCYICLLWLPFLHGMIIFAYSNHLFYPFSLAFSLIIRILFSRSLSLHVSQWINWCLSIPAINDIWRYVSFSDFYSRFFFTLFNHP